MFWEVWDPRPLNQPPAPTTAPHFAHISCRPANSRDTFPAEEGWGGDKLCRLQWLVRGDELLIAETLRDDLLFELNCVLALFVGKCEAVVQGCEQGHGIWDAQCCVVEFS